MKKKFLLLIIGFLLASCAATLPYAIDYPLTDQYFHSRDNIFYGRVPTGWFSATDDTLGESLTVWLLKEDFSATITVREIKLDSLSRKQVDNEGLALLASMSRAFKNIVAVRAGYSEIGSLNFGAGIHLPKFDVDYSFSKFDAEDQIGNSHRISLMFTLQAEIFKRSAE